MRDVRRRDVDGVDVGGEHVVPARVALGDAELSANASARSASREATARHRRTVDEREVRDDLRLMPPAHHAPAQRPIFRRYRAAPSEPHEADAGRTHAIVRQDHESLVTVQHPTVDDPAVLEQQFLHRVDLDPRIGGEVVQRHLASDHEEAVVACCGDQGERPRLTGCGDLRTGEGLVGHLERGVGDVHPGIEQHPPEQRPGAPRGDLDPVDVPGLGIHAGFENDGSEAASQRRRRDLVSRPATNAIVAAS